MSLNRYQEDLIVTPEDFAGCDWKTALAGANSEGYDSMQQALAAAAKQAIREDRQAHGKTLWLLSDACSMRLSPDSANEPFKPFLVLHDRRSPIPDDFLESDIAFFAQIVNDVDEPWLKARLADLVWLMQRPRKIEFALTAIDSYRSIPLDIETWADGGEDCWPRAISLARMLSSGAGERLQNIEASIIEAFTSVTSQDGFLGVCLADLLKSNGLGKDHAPKTAKKLYSLAREFESKGEFHRTREYFRASADWFEVSGDNEKATAMVVKEAENWVKEAEAQLNHKDAIHHYQNAIKTYRTIPKSMRASHQVDDRIAQLRRLLNESGQRSWDEMSTVRASLDISQFTPQDARNLVKGKNPIEALKAFVNLSKIGNAETLRKSTIERIDEFPIRFLFSETSISRDGRVTSIRPGGGDNEDTIRSEMIRDYHIQVGVLVQGGIYPAQEVLLQEHRLQETDFVNLARQSPIVPIGREHLFGKALFAGYDRDFVTALHILVPQIEHMVRCQLKQAGVQTTTLANGIETENNLNWLMGLPQTEEILGEDLSFEIKALFCDSFGSNLRNEIAHGLLDDRACYSVSAIYAWWLGLKIVFNTFWNAMYNDTQPSEQGEKS